jgi:hypothetical protein
MISKNYVDDAWEELQYTSKFNIITSEYTCMCVESGCYCLDLSFLIKDSSTGICVLFFIVKKQLSMMSKSVIFDISLQHQIYDFKIGSDCSFA